MTETENDVMARAEFWVHGLTVDGREYDETVVATLCKSASDYGNGTCMYWQWSDGREESFDTRHEDVNIENFPFYALNALREQSADSIDVDWQMPYEEVRARLSITEDKGDESDPDVLYYCQVFADKEQEIQIEDFCIRKENLRWHMHDKTKSEYDAAVAYAVFRVSDYLPDWIETERDEPGFYSSEYKNSRASKNSEEQAEVVEMEEERQ